jgi:hypothetical protein
MQLLTLECARGCPLGESTPRVTLFPVTPHRTFLKGRVTIVSPIDSNLAARYQVSPSHLSKGRTEVWMAVRGPLKFLRPPREEECRG